MDNNDLNCSCEEGFNKGVMKKCLETDKFTIFGNLNKNNYIILRYNGDLSNVKRDDLEIYLYYTFDNDWANKKDIKLAKCLMETNAYCTSISLGEHEQISFGFYDNEGIFDLNNNNSTFNFEIANDVISDIMKRYGFEKNEELPTLVEYKVNYIMSTESIFTKIKNFLKKFFYTKKAA